MSELIKRTTLALIPLTLTVICLHDASPAIAETSISPTHTTSLTRSDLATHASAPYSAFEISHRELYKEEDFPLTLLFVGDPPEGVTRAQVDAALTHAARAWSEVSCATVQIDYGGATARAGSFTRREIPVAFLDSPCLDAPTAPLLGSAPCLVNDSFGIVLNLDDYRWVMLDEQGYVPLREDGIPSAFDLKATITHELGHILGLSHPPVTDPPLATMFPSYRRDGGQATLDADDRAGLCTMYPKAGAEETCASDAACKARLNDPGARCVDIAGFQVCQEERGDMGDYCASNLLHCPGVCLITSSTGQTGLCTKVCDEVSDCPDGWRCEETSAQGASTRVNHCLPEGEPIATGCSSANQKSSAKGLPFALLFILFPAFFGIVRRNKKRKHHLKEIA